MRALAATRPTYSATFERAENGSWVAVLLEEPNVHSYGDTLLQARRNIREAITTLFGPFEGDGFELAEDVRLPEAVLARVQRARRQRGLAQEKRTEARVAEEAVAATTRQAIASTNLALGLLEDHVGFMKAHANDPGLVEDVLLPEGVLLTLERANLERRTARRQRKTARAAAAAAAAVSGEAVVVNREAVRVLMEDCGLTTAEAAAFLDLSPQRAEQLLGG